VTQEKWKQRRSVLRRFLVYIWLITFAPVASLVIQPYACEGNISADIWFNGSSLHSNRWAFDQSQSCSDALFQALTFVSTFILVFYIILSPLIMLFFTVRTRRFKLHGKYKLNYGSDIYRLLTINCYPSECVFLISDQYLKHISPHGVSWRV
jgi:hypothetical protein